MGCPVRSSFFVLRSSFFVLRSEKIVIPFKPTFVPLELCAFFILSLNHSLIQN